MNASEISARKERRLIVIDAAIEGNAIFNGIPGDLEHKQEVWSDANEMIDRPEYEQEIDPEPRAAAYPVKQAIQALTASLQRRTRKWDRSWEDIEYEFNQVLELDTEEAKRLRASEVAVYDAALKARAAIDALRRKWGKDFDDEEIVDGIWEHVQERTPAEIRKRRELELLKWDLVGELQDIGAHAKKSAGSSWDDEDLGHLYINLVMGSDED